MAANKKEMINWVKKHLKDAQKVVGDDNEKVAQLIAKKMKWNPKSVKWVMKYIEDSLESGIVGEGVGGAAEKAVEQGLEEGVAKAIGQNVAGEAVGEEIAKVQGDSDENMLDKLKSYLPELHKKSGGDHQKALQMLHKKHPHWKRDKILKAFNQLATLGVDVGVGVATENPWVAGFAGQAANRGLQAVENKATDWYDKRQEQKQKQQDEELPIAANYKLHILRQAQENKKQELVNQIKSLVEEVGGFEAVIKIIRWAEKIGGFEKFLSTYKKNATASLYAEAGMLDKIKKIIRITMLVTTLMGATVGAQGADLNSVADTLGDMANQPAQEEVQQDNQEPDPNDGGDKKSKEEIKEELTDRYNARRQHIQLEGNWGNPDADTWDDTSNPDAPSQQPSATPDIPELQETVITYHDLAMKHMHDALDSLLDGDISNADYKELIESVNSKMMGGLLRALSQSGDDVGESQKDFINKIFSDVSDSYLEIIK